MTIEDLFLVGVNHLTAPVSCREKLAAAENQIPEVLDEVRNLADLGEVVILSTCSRMEIVAVGEDPETSLEAVKTWFLERSGRPEAVYLKKGADALRHLFRVTAGLDSWIIGESEIQGQVKRAYELALRRGATGPVLNRAFQSAMAAGKSIRSRTGLQNGICSIGGAAALLAKKIFSDPERGRVTIFGAGEAAEAVARHLAAKNFSEIWVANRSLERARVMAGPLGGRAVAFEIGFAHLAQSEVAIFSTSAPEPLLNAGALARLVADRRRPLLLIDLGLPRNVDPACATVPGVSLYNLDDLKMAVQDSMSRKAAQRDEAEVLAALAADGCLAELEKAQARKCRVVEVGL